MSVSNVSGASSNQPITSLRETLACGGAAVAAVAAAALASPAAIATGLAGYSVYVIPGSSAADSSPKTPPSPPLAASGRASPTSTGASPEPAISRSLSPEINEEDLNRVYDSIVHAAAPEQSFAVDAGLEKEWVIIDYPEVVEPEEAFVFPELLSWGQAAIQAAGGIVNWVRNIDLTWHDPEALRIKALKYEALLETLNKSLTEQGLETLSLPKSRSYDVDYLRQVRDLFELEALNRLREGVESGDKRYNKVCFALYTENNLDKANQELFGLFGLQPPGSGPGILDRLEDSNKTVNKVDASKTTNPLNRWGRSLKDKLGFGFSPIGAGNPPQKMFNLRMGDRDIGILGFGSPTMQKTNFEAVIDPLFKGYLRELKEQGKVHLYVSNQNALNEENARNKVIMALADEFPETFIAVTQSKNTNAYHAKANPGDIRSAQTLKTSLHANFFVEDISKSGCGLAGDLKDDAHLQRYSREILDYFHKSLFCERKALTESEEKLLIELYYNFLTLKILKDRKVDFVNFTCKDGIDRGMGSLAWFVMMIEFAQGRQNEPETEAKLMNTFFTRAYWTRKRNILHERIERPLADMRTLGEIEGGYQKVYQKLEEEFGKPAILSHTAPVEDLRITDAAAAAAT